jgi:hypothetical protein
LFPLTRNCICVVLATPDGHRNDQKQEKQWHDYRWHDPDDQTMPGQQLLLSFRRERLPSVTDRSRGGRGDHLRYAYLSPIASVKTTGADDYSEPITSSHKKEMANPAK